MTHYTLTVTRNRAWYGRARALILFALTPSGEVKLGKVRSGKSVAIDVPNDATEIFGKMDWGKSLPLNLAFVEPGDTIYANLWFTFNPAQALGVSHIPCALETQPR